MSSDWSKLPDDLIESIISLLPLQDYVRFGAVCRSWCSVTKQKNCRPTSQAPWMLLSDTAATNTRAIYSLYEEKIFNMDLPDIYGRRCCGSSHGWLVTIDDDLVLHLCHPFSRARIQLPRLPAWTNTPAYLPYTWHPYRNKCVYKVIISADPTYSEDFLVLALLVEMRSIAFWRPGMFGWFDLGRPKARIEDAIWHEGKFYVITGENRIIVIDPCSDPIVKTFNLKKPEAEVERLYAGRQFLVEFMGELLVVYKLHECLPDLEVFRRKRAVGFRIFKVDLIRGSMDLLETIGDYAVLLGNNQSVAISACEFKGCRKNSIYFTGGTEWPTFIADAGIYNLSDETVEPFSPNDVFSPLESPSVWFVPNPW